MVAIVGTWRSWLARFPDTEEVSGSNPLVPTIFLPFYTDGASPGAMRDGVQNGPRKVKKSAGSPPKKHQDQKHQDRRIRIRI